MLSWNEQSATWWFRLEEDHADLNELVGMKYVLSHLDTLETDDLHEPMDVSSSSSSFSFAC